jgi:hypothetical protein
VGHGYNLAIEMTMSVRDGARTEHSATTAAVGVTHWATEFERVYLMSAARIRGKRKPDTASRSGDECRLVIVLQIHGGNSVPQHTRKQLLSAGAAGSI